MASACCRGMQAQPNVASAGGRSLPRYCTEAPRGGTARTAVAFSSRERTSRKSSSGSAPGRPRPPVVPRPLDREALARSLTCPSCLRDMSTHPYYGPGNVVIDTCDACNVVWLDFGELQQIVDAPGKDRGQRERSARRADAEDVDLLAILAGRFGRHDRAE